MFAGARHTPTLAAAPDVADRLITCVAATKTFNLAGAHVGACFTSNADLKRRLDARIMAAGLGSYNLFGMLATEAGWRTGEAWLDALLPYLAANRDRFENGIAEAAPGARAMRLPATYLAWIDFSGTGLKPDDVAARVGSRAGFSPARASNSVPAAKAGCGSISPHHARSWMRHSAAWSRPSRMWESSQIAGRVVRRPGRCCMLMLRPRCAGWERPIAMRKPVVGVIGNTHQAENRFAVQQVGERNLKAIAEVVGALPLMFAGVPELTDIDTLLAIVDGIVLTGARANVHPRRFRCDPHPAHEPYDERRDGMALSLVETAVEKGIPVFGICRGFQEMNVAFGGTLHPEIRELPGRMNHRMPRLANGEIHPDPTVVFADRHEVRLTPGGTFERLLGRDTIRVNSLHGQGIQQPGARIVIEGIAEDGTIEAIRIADAPGFALGVQWHAEYDPQRNPINATLFRAFGDAVRAYHNGRRVVA